MFTADFVFVWGWYNIVCGPRVELVGTLILSALSCGIWCGVVCGGGGVCVGLWFRVLDGF